MVTELVLSLFPGLDLLGRAFREVGYCVVTGPDVLFGGRIEDFRGVAGRFDGVIGGSPCQDFSSARRVKSSGEGVRLLGEFLRVVRECGPTWFLLENVPRCPDVCLSGYRVQRFGLSDLECGGRQLRLRDFQFGHREGWVVSPQRVMVTDRGSVRVKVTGRRACAMASGFGELPVTHQVGLQGLPADFRAPGLSRRAFFRAVGNGVPLTMGRVVAAAVLGCDSPGSHRSCVCGCGRAVTRRSLAIGACRKRMERRRRGGRLVVTGSG